ncbi:Bacilysin biosynthesis oxidoreductase BacC [Tolypocladium ophioglossoides CBS 100239]|uniref:Bacilysin biosynthesis oxidoreductase BacC n=1 Tax=Tolypocladium ophioglossoides (strain CBS 100239) TaxID=1163406 RepID=A0A0L0NID3_TOLOC|nr:Bacilysin biosynthesis oxidoreductase BacC [Tolypocladium ophioglossoides CBS 100239]
MTLFPGVALVTGAGSGIGKQIAISFAAEGCRRIAIFDHGTTGLEETKGHIETAFPGVDVLPVKVDVRVETEIVDGIAQVIQQFERIDYAINCAGIFGPTKPSHEWHTSEFDNIFNTNLRGLWICSREEVKHMMAQEPLPTHDGRPGCRGSIVNMASNLGLVSKDGTPAYNASKTAIISITRTDAIDYSPHNIRVNCVCPGIIDTPLTAEIPDDAPGVLIAPMKRKGTPQEVADAVLFLSSPKASFIQGSSLTVDGGYVIN